MTKEQFDTYSQADKNQLLGLDTVVGETFVETFTDEETGKLGAIIKDSGGNITTKLFDIKKQVEVKDDGSTETERFRDRETDLLLKKQSPEGLTDKETIELAGIQEELSKRPYETAEEKDWGVAKNKLIMGKSEAKEFQMEVSNAANLLLQEQITSGALTPSATFLQEVLEPFGVDLKFLTDFVGLEILNPAEDSARLRALGNKFGIALSGDLAGNISNLELQTLLQSTINLGSPEEFNKKFVEGLLYLAEKGVYEAEAAVGSKSAEEWALKMDEFYKKFPVPAFMDDFYSYEDLAELNLGIEDKLNLDLTVMPELETRE